LSDNALISFKSIGYENVLFSLKPIEYVNVLISYKLIINYNEYKNMNIQY